MKRASLLFAAMAIAPPLAAAQTTNEATVDATVALVEPITESPNSGVNSFAFGSITISICHSMISLMCRLFATLGARRSIETVEGIKPLSSVCG
ncbi:MAG: hypothetical protein NXH70_11340 [Hyphomonas sp.]|jgi:hypothetical protein|nr:hypothetical protein [Hyphomonas sp.]